MGTRPNTELGLLLKRHRVRHDLTQAQLANRSGVSVRTIREIERGTGARPRGRTVALVAGALGLSGQERAALSGVAGGRVGADEAHAGPVAPPSPLDALLGREAEVGALASSLRTGAQRLVTVTGLGGVGKTRLALGVAGVLHGAEGFSVLWHSTDPRYPAGAGPSWPERLLDRARPAGAGRATLLVLDGGRAGAERVLPALRDCRDLRVLITASGPLGLPGERVFPLAPLAVPERGATGAEAVSRLPSVALLACHARRVRPDFRVVEANAEAVAALVGWADGVPSALEALASWFALYEPEELRGHVAQDPVAFLGGTAGAVRRALGGLGAGVRALLPALVGLGRDWSVADAARASGLAGTACAGLLRGLLAAGVLRPTPNAPTARLRVPILVRHLCAPLAEVEALAEATRPEAGAHAVSPEAEEGARTRGGAARRAA
ncbi:helix-turn-helix domain-containing protein [Actinosynnema pretiosum]|uniref:helix-turn-helix domain-containing protein n=1 Tax=Actinosynnema pretiosum TaxID=42197 RepID=UPI0031D689AA